MILGVMGGSALAPRDSPLDAGGPGGKVGLWGLRVGGVMAAGNYASTRQGKTGVKQTNKQTTVKVRGLTSKAFKRTSKPHIHPKRQKRVVLYTLLTLAI